MAIIRQYKLKIILGLMLCMMSITICAKDEFRIIDYRLGLNSGTINHIVFDKQGFAWLSTPDGIIRYDGVLFYPYTHQSGNDHSLYNNNVIKTLPATCGMWIGAGNALQYYDYHTGKFYIEQYIDSNGKVSKINQDRIISLFRLGDKIFATDNKGYMYGKQEDEQFFSLLQKGVYSLCPIGKSKMAGLRKNGLYLFSADGRKALGVYKTSPLPITWKSFLYYSKNNHLLYYGNGIGYNSQAFIIQNNRFTPTQPRILPANLMAVIDFQGGVAFGLDGGGVIFQKGTQTQVFNTQNSNLSNDAIFCLDVSPQNTLWVGTYRGGLNVLNPSNKQFNMLTRDNGCLPYDIVTAVLPQGNNIYMGLDGGGLCIYDKLQKTSHTLTTSNSSLPDNHVIGLLEEGKKLWLAVYTKGLVEYDIPTGSFTQYPIPRKSTIGNDIWTFCKDIDGNIWVGGYNLNLFNTKTRQFYTNKAFQALDCSSIISQGNCIWVATHDKGIYCFDQKSKKVLAHYETASQSHHLPYNQIRHLFLDSNNHLWIATLSDGLYVMNLKNKTIKHYGEKEGLTSNQVASISEDSKGNLWIGTLNGLFRYHPDTQSFMRLGEDEGIATTFTYNAATIKNGIAYMGSTKGLLVFSPQNIKNRLDFNKVSLASLHLLSGNQELFNLYGNEEKQLKLDHDQNFFIINFSIPEYESPSRIHFSCKLKGLEETWRDLGNKREVAYTNVPAGNYEFMIRCTGEDGQWLKPTILKIHITPPWYATWWAYLLWSLIVIGIIIAVIWAYLHELDIKHKMQIVNVQRKTMKKLNEAKMDFYARATHELRTPVFLISAQIEELIHMPQPVTVPLSFLHSLSNNSKKLNALISRVIDIRKMEKIDIALNLQQQDVVKFCERLSEDYKELCDQKHILYRMRSEPSCIQLDFDQDKLETIITNLISNAFKYTKIGGKITLNVTEEAECVVFSIADNGIGILESMQTSIFENYFRTKRGEKQSTGDGIGLATVKQLVELHQGKIKVESEVNKGSNFTFFTPKGLNKSTQAETEKAVPTAPVIANPAATHSILIIDDEHDTVNILERNLCADFKVLKAYDGKEGLEIAAKELPDIIVSDLMMPNIDGMQFLRTLKEDKKLQHIKVIIFTAKTAEEDMLEAFDNGADAYLTKPISLKLLRKRIDRLIEQGENAQLTADITNKTKSSYNKEEQIFLLRCREVIDNNLQNSDLSIDLIADAMAMSHSSLYKKIKGMTGMSLIDFINDYKIYKAVEMFRQGATNVETVRMKCGFNDAKNFRNIFKRKKGVTPKQFVQDLYK